MKKKRIESYFKQQLQLMIRQSASERDGFLAYFADREAKDEEILGLLAVSVTMSGESPLLDHFPTPAEALAALSKSSRAEICREFRKLLRASLQHARV